MTKPETDHPEEVLEQLHALVADAERRVSEWNEAHPRDDDPYTDDPPREGGSVEVAPTDGSPLAIHLTASMSTRVAAYASKHKVGMADAVDALLGIALARLDASSAGGHKRWAGVSADARSAAAQRAVNARWRRGGKNDFTVEQILKCADAHHDRTGKWPTAHSGAVDDVPGEAWLAINNALRVGSRGLPKGSSLHQLLVAHGRREAKDDLTVEQILASADAHHKRTGKWPTQTSGVVDDAPGETWKAINSALRVGSRGLPKGSSLHQLLVAHGRREAKDDLTVEQILARADAHHARTRKWPTETSGVVHDAPGETWTTWAAINRALGVGGRGLPGGSSLYKVLVAHGRREAKDDLTVEQILAWADAHHARTRKWPTSNQVFGSGAVDDAPGETWKNINAALRVGTRGLPKGSSLHQLLVAHGREQHLVAAGTPRTRVSRKLSH